MPIRKHQQSSIRGLRIQLHPDRNATLNLKLVTLNSNKIKKAGLTFCLFYLQLFYIRAVNFTVSLHPLHVKVHLIRYIFVHTKSFYSMLFNNICFDFRIIEQYGRKDVFEWYFCKMKNTEILIVLF